MATFLQLAQALRQEVGVAGSGPTTVVGQTGELKRLVDWTAQAWLEIAEERREWEWLRSSVSFNTTAGVQTYAPASAPMSLTNFGSWVPESFRYYITATGTATEQYMTWMEYDHFRDYYLYGSRRTEQGIPLAITAAPNKSLLIGPLPSDVYTIVGEYYAKPTELTVDADVPAMPDRFHKAIIYRAMMSYGAFEAAPEVYQRGEAQYRQIMRRLETDQMPAVTLGCPLA